MIGVIRQEMSSPGDAACDDGPQLRRSVPESSMNSIAFEETALFRLLGPKRGERIRPSLRSAHFSAGQHLYLEGQAVQYLYALRAGEVRTLKDHASGRPIELERCGPGDLFGLAALSGTATHGESAQGLSAGEAWRLPRRVLQSLLAEDPSIACALLVLLAERLQHAHDRLCSFAGDAVPARIARALLEKDPGALIRTTRRVLGESAGTTVETAIRVLRRFERSGWIEGGVGWLRVVDRAALERISGVRGPSPSDSRVPR